MQEIIALAVFWVQNTIFNTAATVALTGRGELLRGADGWTSAGVGATARAGGRELAV